MAQQKLNVGDSGDDIRALHERLKAHGVEVSAEEQKRKFFGPSTRAAVSGFQKAHGIDTTGGVCEKTAALLMSNAQPVLASTAKEMTAPGFTRQQSASAVAIPSGTASTAPTRPAEAAGKLTGPFQTSPGTHGGQPPHPPSWPSGSAAGPQYRLEGRILLDSGTPAANLNLFLFGLGFGGVAAEIARARTNESGNYAFDYDPGGKVPNLEVRAADAEGKLIPLSKILFGASEKEVLNLVEPGGLRPLAGEYQRLSGDLAKEIGDLAHLKNAREDAERQDLTILNRATGWDARLIALLAIAESLSGDPDVKLPPEPVYGLLRAGLPSDKCLLAQVDADVVEQVLRRVRDAGIVEIADQQIGEFKPQFAAFANKMRLATPAAGSRSTFGEWLKASGLNADAQTKFASVYFRHRGDTGQLWENARQAGVDESQINKLQLQGKLAFLAGNSEAMTTRLMRKQIRDPVELVRQGFYDARQWKAEISALAGNDREKLNALIPPAYEAEKVEDRIGAYAEDMARKVRLSYPTQVIGDIIEKDDSDAFRLGAARTATAKLLNKAASQGFRLGATPVEAFFRDHPEVRADMVGDEFKKVQEQMKTLQRVYQITPSNEAMPVLLKLGLKSAYDVVAVSEKVFVERFAKELPSPEQAELVYRKAMQVSSVTQNLVTVARKWNTDLAIPVMSVPPGVRESARTELIKNYPTMEMLFGSMDFCECEHCRSVLSPAAYLVDLLRFLDPEEAEWEIFLTLWKNSHQNQDYLGKFKKPYDALIERRPDLPHIPLTCENTNVVLPYIDVVNEILEYYVVHEELTKDAAHDTGEASTAELLAEPQNVIKEAYDKLCEISYPLPFDLWIETAREFTEYFDVPLWRLLETLRKRDDLFTPDEVYDRAAIFFETLRLSPAEVKIFTNSDPLSKWFLLYGLPDDIVALTEAVDPDTGQRIDLNSAKTLSRRLGVTYKELVEIIQTGFVNPKLTQLRLLYTLRVSIHDARFYCEYKYLLSADPTTLSTEDQQRRLEVEAFSQKLEQLSGTFNVPAAALEAALQAIPFSDILVLADTDTGCNFDKTTLRYSDGRKVDGIACLKINLFVRLWRKLGWSIEETDRALQTFVPKNAPFEPAHFAKQPLKTALIYLAHLKLLDEKWNLGKLGRLKLLALWSDIATTGRNSLYAQLFLTPSVLKSAPVFDHPLGQYLTDPDIKLKDHVLAVQSALGLTADEIGRILGDAGKVLDTAELSLPNVSLLYRYGLLAKALKLSVRELIALKQISGLNPCKLLHPDPLTTIEEDHPFSQTLRFIEAAEGLKGSGLNIEDLEYLLLHQFDPTGKYRPDRVAALSGSAR
jgi:peptidoglycan hydrolase-like protein with peptidoglycan-binding domain